MHPPQGAAGPLSYPPPSACPDRMQTIIEFAPWVIFGLVYKFAGGIYPATAALMGAMALMLVYDWLSTRKVPQMHLILAILVWVFGAATLLLRDVRFLQWKASVFYWIAGLVFVGSVWIGKKTLLERIMGKGLPEDVKIPGSSWRNTSLIMGAFYLLMGAANIWVALNRSEADWVFFKVWIAGPVGIVFTLGIVGWMLRDILFAKETPS
jgi:intracellular septation protein